jgi:hypothetical protein
MGAFVICETAFGSGVAVTIYLQCRANSFHVNNPLKNRKLSARLIFLHSESEIKHENQRNISILAYTRFDNSTDFMETP